MLLGMNKQLIFPEILAYFACLRLSVREFVYLPHKDTDLPNEHYINSTLAIVYRPMFCSNFGDSYLQFRATDCVYYRFCFPLFLYYIACN